MRRQATAQTQKETILPQMRGLLSYAAVRATPVHEMLSNGSVETRFDYDFSQVAVRPSAPVISQDYSNASCPLFPQRCPFGGACHTCPPRVQAKLKVGQPGDKYEREADYVADNLGQDQEFLKTRGIQAKAVREAAAPPIVNEVLSSPSQPLDASTRSLFETRFEHDFSQVRIYADEKAAESAHAVNALAYTFGQNVVFGKGKYQPRTKSGLRLLAHELTHVIQQGGSGLERDQSRALSPPRQPYIQRTLGDGHDLTSPRFSRLLDLEEAYDDETVLYYRGSGPGHGSSGRGVQAIQHALYDLGYSLPRYGADGLFGSRTRAAVKAFQRDNPPLNDDGEVGPLTMAALDARFGGVPTLPAPAVLSAPWTPSCVHSVLCPWSPHTVNVLRTRITLKSFDSISWADEEWDGASWVSAPFPGGGYNTGTEIGVLNSSCESMSETLYHEVLHAEQPTTHRTTREKESYAYRIGEEFSIAMGLGGRSALRSTDVEGREFADPAKVGTFVAATYPSVPAGGGGDEILGKAATHGHVRVQRLSGSIYTRPAVVGEKVPGPMTVVTEVTHPTAGWTCP